MPTHLINLYMFKDIATVSPFSRYLLIVIIASYIAIKNKQIKILKFKKEVGIDYTYKK